jgi:hypothetical protein
MMIIMGTDLKQWNIDTKAFFRGNRQGCAPFGQQLKGRPISDELSLRPQTVSTEFIQAKIQTFGRCRGRDHSRAAAVEACSTCDMGFDQSKWLSYQGRSYAAPTGSHRASPVFMLLNLVLVRVHHSMPFRIRLSSRFEEPCTPDTHPPPPPAADSIRQSYSPLQAPTSQKHEPPAFACY